MRYIKYFLVGIVFGIVMAKSEAISWYRIFEMFHFHSFRMYGIISTAVATGIVGLWIIKAFEIKDYKGNVIKLKSKKQRKYSYILGGILFGLGWALCGACPGPILVNIGYGVTTMIIVFLFAIIGTYVYGILRTKLPH